MIALHKALVCLLLSCKRLIALWEHETPISIGLIVVLGNFCSRADSELVAASHVTAAQRPNYDIIISIITPQ